MYYVYILESINFSTYYVGQTNNLINRLKKHNTGRVTSTRKRKPYKLVYYAEYKTRSEAMVREWEIKKKFNTERRKKLVLSFDVTIINKLGL